MNAKQRVMVAVKFDKIPQKSVNNYRLVDLVTTAEWEQIRSPHHFPLGSLATIITRTKIGQLNVKQLSELCFVLFDDNERMPEGYLPCFALSRLLDRAVQKHREL